ncbi:hypothetical protein [Lewinella sp. 4G2]|uniref:hypothetical protein n=1 Tax=Lewinella sp. 4G2 TaxID=1803372 RepID=UPI0012F9C5CB|nr:hypothetical protein [Lewinella sp. 4G2]
MTRTRIILITVATAIIVAQAVIYYQTGESGAWLSALAMVFVIASMAISFFEEKKSKEE